MFGWSTDSKVERQQGQFFRLSVEEKHATAGFVLTCRGLRGSKFRIFMFDVEGNLLYQVENCQSHHAHIKNLWFFCSLLTAVLNGLFLNNMIQEDGTKSKSAKGNPQTTMYFTSFDTYRLEPSPPSDKSIPEVFCKLESYTCSKKTITPGKYLLCVHGDNFMGKSYFNLLVSPLLFLLAFCAFDRRNMGILVV